MAPVTAVSMSSSFEFSCNVVSSLFNSRKFQFLRSQFFGLHAVMFLSESHYPTAPIERLERHLFFRPMNWMPSCDLLKRMSKQMGCRDKKLTGRPKHVSNVQNICFDFQQVCFDVHKLFLDVQANSFALQKHYFGRPNILNALGVQKICG